MGEVDRRPCRADRQGGPQGRLIHSPPSRSDCLFIPGAPDMAPKVLISDKLSAAAVQIFKERGIETDIKVGLDKEELARTIENYDGLAIRSATKVSAKILD